jgi:hypothetical protein
MQFQPSSESPALSIPNSDMLLHADQLENMRSTVIKRAQIRDGDLIELGGHHRRIEQEVQVHNNLKRKLSKKDDSPKDDKKAAAAVKNSSSRETLNQMRQELLLSLKRLEAEDENSGDASIHILDSSSTPGITVHSKPWLPTSPLAQVNICGTASSKLNYILSDVCIVSHFVLSPTDYDVD